LEDLIEKKNEEVEDKEEIIKKGRNVIGELNTLLQQEKDKYNAKALQIEDDVRNYEKTISERKSEVQDLKQKITLMEQSTKWKKKETKRKYTEEKEKIETLLKETKK